MDLIRRNTDYALRLMVNLAGRFNEGYVSSRVLSQEEGISYQLSCKLLQKLNAAGLLKSAMGVNGGFSLNKPPSKISLSEVIEVVQGPISINRCLLRRDACPRQSSCPITRKLKGLQHSITESLTHITVEDLL